jgi:hypothetical protein
MMKARWQSFFENIGYFVFWLVLGVLAVFTAFQLHATWIAIAISVVENPSLRPPGWSMDSVHGLGRVFWLIIGILWLVWVMYTESHLREGRERKRLMPRFFIFLIVLGAIYGVNYLILYLLP